MALGSGREFMSQARLCAGFLVSAHSRLFAEAFGRKSPRGPVFLALGEPACPSLQLPNLGHSDSRRGFASFPSNVPRERPIPLFHRYPSCNATIIPAPKRNITNPATKWSVPRRADRHRSARAVVVNPRWIPRVIRRSGITKMKL